VKTPHIRLEGERIPEEVLAFLRDRYGDVEVIRDEEEELIEITRSEWYAGLEPLPAGLLSAPACRRPGGPTPSGPRSHPYSSRRIEPGG
jgi:hypothetical protein